MHKIRAYIATALFVVLILSFGGIADAQKRSKNRKTKRTRIGTGVVAERWEPEENSIFYKFTRALPKVDKVELYLVGSIRGVEVADNALSVPGIYKGRFRVRTVASKTLLDSDAEQFAQIWRGLKRGNGGGCFTPAHYIRFYSSGQLLFETSVCFHCHNLTLPNGENNEPWGFDVDGKSGQELLNALKGLLSPPMA